jgi:hypothetical protein
MLLQPAGPGSQFFSRNWTPVDSNDNVAVWLPVLDAKSTNAPKLSFKNDWCMKFAFNFFSLHPAWVFLVYEPFMNSFGINHGQRQGHTNPKVPWQAWGTSNVQDICCHDSCYCFCKFQFADFLHLHMPRALALPSNWTKSTRQGHFISLPLWRPWMKSSIVPLGDAGVHEWSHV